MNDHNAIRRLLDQVEQFIYRYGRYVSNTNIGPSLTYIDQARNLLPIGVTPQIQRSALGLARRAVFVLRRPTEAPEKG